MTVDIGNQYNRTTNFNSIEGMGNATYSALDDVYDFMSTNKTTTNYSSQNHGGLYGQLDQATTGNTFSNTELALGKGATNKDDKNNLAGRIFNTQPPKGGGKAKSKKDDDKDISFSEGAALISAMPVTLTGALLIANGYGIEKIGEIYEKVGNLINEYMTDNIEKGFDWVADKLEKIPVVGKLLSKATKLGGKITSLPFKATAEASKWVGDKVKDVGKKVKDVGKKVVNGVKKVGKSIGKAIKKL